MNVKGHGENWLADLAASSSSYVQQVAEQVAAQLASDAQVANVVARTLGRPLYRCQALETVGRVVLVEFEPLEMPDPTLPFVMGDVTAAYRVAHGRFVAWYVSHKPWSFKGGMELWCATGMSMVDQVLAAAMAPGWLDYEEYTALRNWLLLAVARP